MREITTLFSILSVRSKLYSTKHMEKYHNNLIIEHS